MKKFPITSVLFLAAACCGCSQNKSQESLASHKWVGGGCDGCEAIFEYGSKKLTGVDTLPDFHEPGPRMVVNGTIFMRDGKTPAKDIILYIYHTDQKGYYSTKGGETGMGKRHGYIRGWIKTGADGKYKFFTLRPAAYPKRSAPEHIHATVKEPDINEYYIDEYLFDDDPLLTREKRKMPEDRGGSGIVSLTKDSQGIFQCHRDIILGKNIPNY